MTRFSSFIPVFSTRHLVSIEIGPTDRNAKILLCVEVLTGCWQFLFGLVGTVSNIEGTAVP